MDVYAIVHRTAAISRRLTARSKLSSRASPRIGFAVVHSLGYALRAPAGAAVLQFRGQGRFGHDGVHVGQSDASLAEGVVKVTEIARRMKDIKVTDRSLIWNSDLMETLELTNLMPNALAT